MKEMPLKLKEFLDELNNVTIPTLLKSGYKQTPINTRESLSNLIRKYVTDIPEVRYVFDDYIGVQDGYNIPCRIYAQDISGDAEVLVHIHGGGHMCGGIVDYDGISRKLAEATRQIVVTPEYRLSPEFPYPVGATDVYKSFKNVFSTLDLRNIKYRKVLNIIGDSGGAANCAWVANRAQYDHSIEINKQVLIYPAVDYTMRSDSVKNDTGKFLLSRAKVKWYFDNYFQNGEDRYAASPLFKPITPDYPATQIFVAGYDPLRDDGLAFGEKLKKANIEAETHVLENMIHAYMLVEDLCPEECGFTYQKAGEFLKK